MMKVHRIQIYRCDICGKEDTQNFIHHLYFFGKGYDGWDYTFDVCSENCYVKLQSMDNKQMYDLQNTLQNRQDLPFKK